MEILRGSKVLIELCRFKQKWGMMLSTGSDSPEAIQAAAPYLSFEHAINLSGGDNAYLFFDSEEECGKAYEATVGDDGPTGANPYDGPGNVYALTCGPDGELQTENT